MMLSNDDSISASVSGVSGQQRHRQQQQKRSPGTPLHSRTILDMNTNGLVSSSVMSSEDDLASSLLSDQDLMISSPFTARRRQKQLNQQQQRQIRREMLHKQNQESPSYVPSDDDVSLFELPSEAQMPPLPFPPTCSSPQVSATMTASDGSLSSISVPSIISSPSSISLISVSLSTLNMQQSPTMVRTEVEELKRKKKKSRKKKTRWISGDDVPKTDATMENALGRYNAPSVSVLARQSASSSSSTTMSSSTSLS